MQNEAKLIEQRNKGAAADVELRVTGESFVGLRKQLFDAWLVTDPRDQAGREKLWLATSMLTRVENMLRGHVQNGRVAQKELDAIRKTGEPKKRFGVL